MTTRVDDTSLAQEIYEFGYYEELKNIVQDRPELVKLAMLGAARNFGAELLQGAGGYVKKKAGEFGDYALGKADKAADWIKGPGSMAADNLKQQVNSARDKGKGFVDYVASGKALADVNDVAKKAGKLRVEVGQGLVDANTRVKDTVKGVGEKIESAKQRAANLKNELEDSYQKGQAEALKEIELAKKNAKKTSDGGGDDDSDVGGMPVLLGGLLAAGGAAGDAYNRRRKNRQQE